MAAAAEDFVLRLVDGVSPGAQAASGAVAELEARLRQGTAAMAETQSRLSEPIKSSTYRDIAADVADARAQLAALDPANAAVAESAQAAADAEKALGESADNAGKGVADASESAAGGSVNVSALAKSTKMLGGELGGTASKAIRLGQSLSKLGPEAALVVVALATLVAGIAAMIAVFAKGIEAAGAMRDELLKFEGAAKGSAAAGKEVQAAVDAVAQSSALSREKIADMAVQLEQAGLKGAELQTALQAMATAGSAGGDEAASAFLKAAKAAKAAGGSVDELAKKTQQELGGVAAEQALSLGAQMQKLKESIAAIFSGADIEPFLKGLHAILSMFDQNHAAGKALKDVVTSFVNTAIGAFLKTAIAMVKLYIAIKQNSVALAAVKVVIYSIVAVFVILGAIAGVIVAGMAAMFAALMSPILAVVAVVMAIYYAAKAVWERIKAITWQDIGKAIVAALLLPIAPFVLIFVAGRALYNKLKNISWSDVGNAIKNAFLSAVAFLASLPSKMVALGSAIINGIVAGLTAAGGAVLSALTGIVSGAVGAVKSLLGIASPSKVFAQMGGHMAGGMEQGLDQGAPNVARAAGGMAVGAAKAASVSGGKGKGMTVNFTGCTFGDGLSKEKLESWVVDIFEKAVNDQAAHA